MQADHLPSPTPVELLFGIRISSVTEAHLVAELLHPVEGLNEARLVATLNVDHVVNLRKNAIFRQAYAWAWRATIDGGPVFAYAKCRGVAPPERITGADLFSKLAMAWTPGQHRLFFCVGSQRVADEVRAFFAIRGFHDGHIAVNVPPFGFDQDEQLSQQLASRAAAFEPTHLIMAVGSPKSEVWTYRHRHELGGSTVLCVGAAVEFLLGLKLRAPRWMQRAGLEWVWRLASEPRRLFRRYCIASFGFLLAIRMDLRTAGQSVV